MEISLFLRLLPCRDKKFGIIFSTEFISNILRVFINVKNIIRHFL